MEMKLENLPYFAIAGFMLLLSMLMYTVRTSGFATFILPTYLTEALLFFTLAFAFYKSFNKGGFTVFIMTLVWLFNQILCWSGLSSVGGTLTFGTWMLLVVQIILTALFFMNQPIKYFDYQSDAWPYASGFVLLLFGAAKMYLDYSMGFSLGGSAIMMFLWGLGISLISLGYIIRPKTKDGSAAFQILGLAFIVISALAIQGPGLTML